MIILGQLLDQPAHGYAIKQILDQLLGSRKLSWGSLYPILKKLEKDSLIKKVTSKQLSGGPTQKVYSITEAGRKYFYDLMLQPTSDSGDTRVHYKLLFFSKISKENRIKILKDYEQYLSGKLGDIQGHLDEYQEQKSLHQSHYILEVLEHTLATYRLERDWVHKLLTKEGEI